MNNVLKISDNTGYLSSNFKTLHSKLLLLKELQEFNHDIIYYITEIMYEILDIEDVILYHFNIKLTHVYCESPHMNYFKVSSINNVPLFKYRYLKHLTIESKILLFNADVP